MILGGYVNISKHYCKSIDNVHPKLAFLMPIMNMLSSNSFCGGSLIPVKNFHISSLLGGLGMVKNSILYPIFDEVIRNLIPSGVPQYLRKYHERLLYGIYEELEEKAPKVLTLDDLEFGFIIWLIASGISIAAFLSEIFRFYIENLLKMHIGLAMLVSIIVRRLGKI